MAIEFGSKQAKAILRREYLSEHKSGVFDQLRQIYARRKEFEIEVGQIKRDIDLLDQRAAELRSKHGISVADELMML